MDFGILNKQENLKTQHDSRRLPVKKDPLEAQSLTDLFDRFVSEIDKMEDKSASQTVTDAVSCAETSRMTNQTKKLMQIIEKKRKEVKRPYLEVATAVDRFASTLRKRLEIVCLKLDSKLLPYMQELERKRKEEEQKAAAKARIEQERLENERQVEAARQAEIARQKAVEQGRADEEAEQLARAASARVEVVPIVVATTPATLSGVETEAGTSKLKTDWGWEIIDFAALPQKLYETRKNELRKAAAPYINARMKAGLRDMPGVRFFQKIELKTRMRR